MSVSLGVIQLDVDIDMTGELLTLIIDIELCVFSLLLTSFTSFVSVTGECIPRSEIISYKQLNNFCIYGSLVNFWT